MSSTAKQIFQSTRLLGFTGRGDKYLAGLPGNCWDADRLHIPSCRL